jgi:DNA-binding transcriptional LysR family regulator
MARRTNWENQIGRRLRLRDLHVLFMVAERGSMAKAAAELGISQPAVSDVIAGLELSLGVRLFDRTPQGVELTRYGGALVKRSVAAFDELKQGIRDIEFMSDPTKGELRLGCSESIAVILTPFIQRFSRQYPRVVVHIDNVVPALFAQGAQRALAPGLAELRDRKFDLIVGRMHTSFRHDALGDDLEIQTLFDDPLVIAAGSQSSWARRRKITLADVIDAAWVLSGPETWNYVGLIRALGAIGLPAPKISIVTMSIPIRIDLLVTGEYITAMPKSVAERYAVKVLPIELPVERWSVAAITLKRRTLSPAVARFVECAREAAKPVIAPPRRSSMNSNQAKGVS